MWHYCKIPVVLNTLCKKSGLSSDTVSGDIVHWSSPSEMFCFETWAHVFFISFKSSAASFYEILLGGFPFPWRFRDDTLLASKLRLRADHGHSGVRQTFVLKMLRELKMWLT
ncbi:hypothetical protein HRI_003337900 [Hibiscus trionum]|uniref:Uncharacterized protein n=1 Tax=Hibiscus trionum TaxID=183268 RepID=A0A9W7IKD6_HIBTR|nr:hypothetical protein HRI_003337900 [Hibiscus trionum]